jgi:hypothetical protein
MRLRTRLLLMVAVTVALTDTPASILHVARFERKNPRNKSVDVSDVPEFSHRKLLGEFNRMSYK